MMLLVVGIAVVGGAVAPLVDHLSEAALNRDATEVVQRLDGERDELETAGLGHERVSQLVDEDGREHQDSRSHNYLN